MSWNRKHTLQRWPPDYDRKRDRIYRLLQAREGDWVEIEDLADAVYGSRSWQDRHAVTSLMTWVRKQHPERRIEALRRLARPGQPSVSGAYRLIPMDCPPTDSSAPIERPPASARTS